MDLKYVDVIIAVKEAAGGPKSTGPIPPQANVENVAIVDLDASAYFEVGIGNTPTYGISGEPAGLSIDPGTGVISGTPSIGSESSSPYSVVVSLATSIGVADSPSFVWTITL